MIGESGDVVGETIDSWKERLPEIVHGYSKEDIWNLNETGIFWQALPDRGFSEKGKQCKCGKKSKQRITVAFIVTATGKKETPVVIWKSKKPRCFGKMHKSALPVKYFDQKKALMTGEILATVLMELNKQLFASNRSILLIMDNAGCHPDNLKVKFTNIRVIFLPPNTTSKLQPLDLGIIQKFEVHYRRLFLRHVLAKIDECETASDVTKSVNILIAIKWVAKAWDMVKPETISKCFIKAGILSLTHDVISRGLNEDEEDDPFLEQDECLRLQNLIDKTVHEGCTLSEYITGDDDLPVGANLINENWEDNFLAGVGQSVQVTEDEETGDVTLIEEPTVLNTNSYKDAIVALENVQDFLQSRGHIQEAASITSTIEACVEMRVSECTQTSIHDYF